MTDSSHKQLFAPTDWGTFENICLDLWKLIWDDRNAQLNGRPGQDQDGVDVYGQPIDLDGGWAGIQCKVRDTRLTEKELRDAVRAATRFKPELTEFILATTARRDKSIQAVARSINQEQREAGRFAVYVYAWDDILQLIGDYPEVYKKYGPAFPSDVDQLPESTRPTCYVRSTNDEFGMELNKHIMSTARQVGFKVVSSKLEVPMTLRDRISVREQLSQSLLVISDARNPDPAGRFEFFSALDQTICIILAPQEVIDRNDQFEIAPHAFPDVLSATYRILDLGQTNNVGWVIRDVFKKGMQRAAKWSTHITRLSLQKSGAPVVEHPVDPELAVEKTKVTHSKTSLEDIFAGWVNCRTEQYPKVIIAPPGRGKTVLLTRFSAWSAGDREIVTSSDLPPVVIFLKSHDIPEVVSPETLWDLVRTRIDDFSSSAGDVDNLMLAEALARCARLFVTLDGLDEYSSRRRDAESLLNALIALQDRHGVRVLVTCREAIWERQLQISERVAKRFEVVTIMPYDRNRASDILTGMEVELRDSALHKEGGPSRWLCNELMLDMAQTTFANGDRPKTLKSRSQLYETWADRMRVEWASYAAAGDPLDFYSNCALCLLKKRRLSIDVAKLCESLGLKQMPLSESQITSMGILAYSGEPQSVMFAHESKYEFFAVRRLAEDFRAVTSDILNPNGLQKLELAQVELDYLQSSAYGFLDEMLTPGFHQELTEYLTRCAQKSKLAGQPKSKLAGQPWKLIRNLIEYVGLTFRPGDGVDFEREERTSELLLTIIEDDNLKIPLRFNAARALERIHPQAPRPYFDYVSDWGEHSWDDTWKKAEALNRSGKVSPYVIRGQALETPAPHTHRAFAPNEDLPMCDALQEKVSFRLGNILNRLMERPVSSQDGEDTSPITVNCSWAWVRWFHPGHGELLQSVIERARSGGYTRTLSNLDDWLNQ